MSNKETAASVVAFRVLNREPAENQKVLVPLYFPTEAHIGAAIVSMHRVLKAGIEYNDTGIYYEEVSKEDFATVLDVIQKLMVHVSTNLWNQLGDEIKTAKKKVNNGNASGI